MTANDPTVPKTKGRVMRSEARYYDLLAWVLTLGRERAFRQRLVELARLAPGETVLDVGCGTGTLAIAAKERVGPSGSVHGIDASPEMIEQATRKAARAGADVRFQTAVVEALPFPDGSFDAVLSTLMLHHLPRGLREQCLQEIRRVLKPGGGLLVVDFATPANARRGLFARFHRHGHVPLERILDLLSDAGLAILESGSVGVSDLHFALATMRSDQSGGLVRGPMVSRSLQPLPTPPWVFAIVVAVGLIAHAVVLRAGWRRLALPALGVAGIAALFVALHLGLAGALHARLRRR